MNQQAERHLVKAESFLAKGDAWYERAADEIIAAQEADTTLSYREIGRWFDRSHTWAQTLVTWRTSGSTSGTPFARGKTGDPAVSETKKLLREAPLEQVERIISSLPRERQR